MTSRRRFGKSRATVIFLAFVVATINGRRSAAIADAPSSYQLANGLKVLIRPISGARDAAVVVHYGVGGDHDPEGRSGLAHLTEHIYITAAAGNAPARSADDFMNRYRSGANAQTGDRYTVFAVVVPSAELPNELADAASRMIDLRITAADLDRERPRLLAELATMFDRPSVLSAQNHAREIIRPTPREGRRGGKPEHVARITVEEVRDHWRRCYRSRNATLSIAGAVDVDETRRTVERLFSKIEAGSPISPSEPGPIIEPRDRVTTLTTAGPSAAAIAFAAPPPTDPNYAAYVVMAARLAKAGTNPTTNVQVYTPLLDDPAALIVSTLAGPGESSQGAKARLTAWLSKTLDAPFRPGEAEEARQTFGFLLGIVEPPDRILGRNPYGVAFSAARRETLGIQPEFLIRRFQELDAKAFEAVRIEVFGPGKAGVFAFDVPPPQS